MNSTKTTIIFNVLYRVSKNEVIKFYDPSQVCRELEASGALSIWTHSNWNFTNCHWCSTTFLWTHEIWSAFLEVHPAQFEFRNETKMKKNCSLFLSTKLQKPAKRFDFSEFWHFDYLQFWALWQNVGQTHSWEKNCPFDALTFCRISLPLWGFRVTKCFERV